MQTDADVKRDKAVDLIREAAKAISEIVIDRTYGHDEYNSDYRIQLFIVMKELIELADKLDPRS